MMTQFPDDDPSLVAFLKQYQPVAPPSPPNLEQQLMAKITEKSGSNQQNFSLRKWGISATIAASLLLVWGSYRWFFPSPKVAIQSQDLDAFMVQSWQETMSETTPTASDAFLLDETETIKNY